jgi:rubrerythrin
MYPVAIGAGVLVIALAGRRIAAKGMVDGIHCPGCGYNLTGNLSGVCPECGAPFARR